MDRKTTGGGKFVRKRMMGMNIGFSGCSFEEREGRGVETILVGKLRNARRDGELE